MRSCCSPYMLWSPLKSEAAAQPWCKQGRNVPRSCTPIMGQFHVHTVVVKRAISFFHQTQIPQFHSGSGRGASDASVLVLSSTSSLLMAIM